MQPWQPERSTTGTMAQGAAVEPPGKRSCLGTLAGAAVIVVVCVGTAVAEVAAAARLEVVGTTAISSLRTAIATALHPLLRFGGSCGVWSLFCWTLVGVSICAVNDGEDEEGYACDNQYPIA